MNDQLRDPLVQQSETPIRFRFAPVNPELSSMLLIYWEVETRSDGVLVDLMHPEWANIRFQLSGDWSYGPTRQTMAHVANHAVISGVTSKAQWAGCAGRGSGFCIMLFPLAWHRLFGADASRYANGVEPLSSLMGDDAAMLEERIRRASSFEERVSIADSYFLHSLSKCPPSYVDPTILLLTGALANPDCSSVEMLIEMTGLPHARLNRLSKRAFGMSPKLLMRRERLLRMLRTMEVRSFREWQAFLDPQYVDQSHMIRDFKYFLGVSPSQYFALERPMLESSIAAFKELWAVGWDPLNSAPSEERW